MTLIVKHAFASLKPDDGTAASNGAVLPSHWNAAHTIEGSYLTRALASASSPATPPDTINIDFYDDNKVPESGGLYLNAGGGSPGIGNQLAITTGIGTFYYVPQAALIRPENFGARGDGSVSDLAALTACMVEQRRTGKTISLGGRQKTYMLSGMFETDPVAGQNIDIRGTGALLKLDPASADIFRFFYILVNTSTTGAIKINLEGFRIDAGDKVSHALEIQSYQAGSPQIGDVRISDIETLPFTANALGQAGAMYIYGAFGSIEIDRCRIGAVKRKTGLTGTSDVSGIYAGRNGVLYTDNIRISRCHIDGVYATDFNDNTNLDGIKLFGRENATQITSEREAYSISDCTFRNCMGRSIKAQSLWTRVDRVACATEAGFLSINSGRKLTEIDFQFGTGVLTNARIDYAVGTGADNVIVATTRPYGIDGQMVIDGVNVTQRGAPSLITRGFLRYAESATSKPARASVRNFQMPESSVTNLVGFASHLDGTVAANSNERLHVEHMQAATVTGSAIEYDRRIAGAKVSITTAGMVHKGTSVPAVTQTVGGPDWTNTVVSPNFGFT